MGKFFKEAKVNAAGNYTKPEMRKRIFNRIKAGGKGGNPGQWSARKAQMLAKAYKKAGGGYTKTAYYKENKQTNLSAKLNEFINKRTKKVVAEGTKYHIHPKKGPMEGKVHDPKIPGGTKGHDYFVEKNAELKSSQKSLKKWTKQKWTTPSGKKSSDTGEVYLPKKKIESLKSTKEGKQRLARANAIKRDGYEKGKQFTRHGEAAGQGYEKKASVEYRGHTFPGYNKPMKSWLPSKKKVVLAKKGDKVKVVHFGAAGYGHNYSAAARKSYLARSAKIKGTSDKFSANYWARKILWAGKGGSKKSSPKNVSLVPVNEPLSYPCALL